jgi:DnaJ-class molecular chaperone
MTRDAIRNFFDVFYAAGAGDERPGVVPADVVFIIDEKPHSTFKREGNDLVYTARLPLVEALTGTAVRMTLLDGRSLTIAVPEVISPTMYVHPFLCVCWVAGM